MLLRETERREDAGSGNKVLSRNATQPQKVTRSGSYSKREGTKVNTPGPC
jgi:hypothetical protein